MLRMILGAVLLLVASCCAPEQLKQPEEAYVQADRLAFDYIAPMLRAYIIDDADLDQWQRDIALQAISDWGFMIDTAEKNAMPAGGRIIPIPEIDG